ncbi:hypothetical protein [Leekyejoonella antrihumi]|uniref:Uncharacterized protein n=1 Tax=Leekyejoonella antrihumi TaxID=1660198 RepID=A0A563E6K1_9MICO|nr:hypothetical protein [Leekyejoonella antrihumi]TWP37929.1 hypothetical protein FGL98_04255 [Leekyejoonella antrihumi]
MRARLGAIAVMTLGMVTIVGCGSSTTSGAGSSSNVAGPTSAAPSGQPSTPATSSRPTPSTSAGASSTPADRTFHGTVLGHGLTCIGFTTTDGDRYALTGNTIPAKLSQVAHSGFQEGNRLPLQAEVTVVGHVAPHAMSTCGYTVLVASKVTITSVGKATVPGS